MGARMPNSSRCKDAYERALDLTLRRDYTTSEVERKLLHDGYSPEEAQKAIGRLVERDLLNDVRYVELYVLQRLAACYGPRYIEEKLYLKGIARRVSIEVIERSIAEESIDLERNARRWIEKVDLDNQRERTKALRRLTARGYEYGLIRRLLEEEIRDDDCL
ncbi:MAG: recombination regulator RecX [Coriobacteriia bacterium]|nr:recombination regulator RecX [Coriobacteriia bacterium]